MNWRRKLLTLVWAVVLTAVIVASVVGLGNIMPRATTFSLATAAREFGTITLDCTYHEAEQTLTVHQETTYPNYSPSTLKEIQFFLPANAYQADATCPAVAKADQARAYPAGFDAGSVTVTTPKIRYAGADNTILIYPLATPLSPYQSTTVGLDYTVKIPHVKHRLGYTNWSVNLGNFYAVPAVYDRGWQTYAYSYYGDPFYNQPYNFDVTLHLPQGYTAATSGVAVGENHFRGDALRDFAVVLSPYFQTLSKTVGDTLVTYYYQTDDVAEISLYTAANALAYFSNQFFDYPYPTLAVVQTDFLEGGMEYGALVYIARDVTDQLSYQNVIVHEIAHQWWYGIVGNNQITAPWLDEGLAEYCTALFFDTHPEYGVTMAKIAQSNRDFITLYQSMMQEYRVRYSFVMTRALPEYNSALDYTINTYTRGMLLFYGISEMVGTANLNQALSHYVTTHRFQFATPGDFITALDHELGHNLVNYFNNYLAGTQ